MKDDVADGGRSALDALVAAKMVAIVSTLALQEGDLVAHSGFVPGRITPSMKVFAIRVLHSTS